VTAGAFSAGNSSVGTESCRNGLIVSGAAASVAATGTTYVIAKENTPTKTSQSATLLRRKASRLNRSAASDAAVIDPTELIPDLPLARGPPLGHTRG
jgi:hypothetical protein